MAETTRDLVIAEAKRLFFQFGFRRITMDEIAANLRMSKKTLYILFPSKKDLVRAVVQTIMKPNLEKIRTVTDRSATIAEFISGAIGVFRGLSADISDPMVSDMRMMPEIWRKVEEQRLKAISHIKEVLEKGKRTGEVRPDLNVDLFLRIFIQIVNRIANPAMMMELNLKPTELAEQIFGIFFYGIVSSKRRPGGVS
jgi:AcrR family transcriptional regulator